MRDVLVLAGNGLAIDLRHHVDGPLDDWNTSEPLQWDLSHPDYDTALWDLFPYARAALSETAGASDFERMKSVLRHAQEQDCPHAVIELRHYLVMAFSMYQLHVDTLDIQSWRWATFLSHLGPRLAGIFSLNYDTTIERLVRLSGQRTFSTGLQLTPWELQIEALRSKPEVAVVKPHGSIDYRSGDGTISMEAVYPLQNWLWDNDLWLNRCHREHWLRPRIGADVVIPTEVSRFRNFQWVKPGNAWLRRQGRQIRECYIAGIGYGECDRPEINVALDSLSVGTRIVIANPSCPPALVEHLEVKGHVVEHWPDGPVLT